jgi:hypothetical protein
MEGLGSTDLNALQIGGNIYSNDDLPQILNLIVQQRYSDHSMMTRAKIVIII